MELELSGEVFSLATRDYDADPNGRWAAGTSHSAVLLDLEKREIHTVKFKGAEGRVAWERLAQDEHVDLKIRVVANNNRLDKVFAGWAAPLSAVDTA